MKGYDLLETVGQIDRQYINSAAEEPRPRKTGVWKRVAAVAACVAVAAAVCIAVLNVAGIFGGKGSPDPNTAATYREVEPTDDGSIVDGHPSAPSFKAFVRSCDILCIVRGKIEGIKEYEFESSRVVEGRNGRISNNKYKSIIDIRINDVIWGDCELKNGDTFNSLYHCCSHRYSESGVKIDNGKEYIFFVSRIPDGDNKGDYDYIALTQYCVVSAEYFTMPVIDEKVYFNNFLEDRYIKESEPTEVPFCYVSNINGRVSDYSTVKLSLSLLMERIAAEKGGTPPPTEGEHFREVEPTDNGSVKMVDYIGMTYEEFVEKNNISCIIRGKATGLKEYAFDPLSEPRAGAGKVEYRSLISIDIKDVIWSDGAVPDAGASINILFGDSSYVRHGPAVTITPGREYIFLMRTSESPYYSYDKVSGYYVPPEYLAMMVDGENVYYLDPGFCPEPIVPDAEKTGEPFTYSSTFGNPVDGRKTDYPTMKSRLIEIMKGITGQDDTPLTEAIREFTALYDSYMPHYGKTMKDFYAAMNYTDDSFKYEYSRELKEPVTINGREYTVMLGFDTDLPQEEWGNISEEDYPEHYIFGGFYVRSVPFTGGNAVDELYEEAMVLNELAVSLADRRGPWNYMPGSEADSKTSLLYMLGSRDGFMNDVPYCTSYHTGYSTLGNAPVFYADKYSDDPQKEPCFNISVTAGKDGDSYDRENGWQLSLSCNWSGQDSGSGRHTPTPTLDAYLAAAKEYCSYINKSGEEALSGLGIKVGDGTDGYTRTDDIDIFYTSNGSVLDVFGLPMVVQFQFYESDNHNLSAVIMEYKADGKVTDDVIELVKQLDRGLNHLYKYDEIFGKTESERIAKLKTADDLFDDGPEYGHASSSAWRVPNGNEPLGIADNQIAVKLDISADYHDPDAPNYTIIISHTFVRNAEPTPTPSP